MSNSARLQGKNVLVTGGCGFLGREICRRICEEGGTPVVFDISRNSYHLLVSHLNGLPANPDVFFFEVDITDEASIRSAFDAIDDEELVLHGLVNNAARNPVVTKVRGGTLDNAERIEEFPTDDWNLDIQVGLTGAFLVSKYFLKSVRISGLTGASIVNVSSDLGLIAPDHRLYNDGVEEDWSRKVKPVTYSVVKAGLIGLSKYLATYEPKIVRSNAVCPSGIFNDHPVDFVEKISSLIPMGRMACRHEVSDLIIYLLSDRASYINGSTIPIDGGRSCW